MQSCTSHDVLHLKSQVLRGSTKIDWTTTVGRLTDKDAGALFCRQYTWISLCWVWHPPARQRLHPCSRSEYARISPRNPRQESGQRGRIDAMTNTDDETGNSNARTAQVWTRKVSPEIRLNKYSGVQRKIDGGHARMGVDFFQLLPCHRIPEEELNQDNRGNGGDNYHYLVLNPIFVGKLYWKILSENFLDSGGCNSQKGRFLTKPCSLNDKILVEMT